MLMLMPWFLPGPLATGTPAPDFSLPDEQGKVVKLSALRGKNVVLIFYPGDNTPICRTQLSQFRDRWEDAIKTNSVVFGINAAPALSHQSFRQKISLPFPLLVDDRRQVAAAYNAALWLLIFRTVYVIDPEGVIRFAKRGKPPVGEVLAAAR